MSCVSISLSSKTGNKMWTETTRRQYGREGLRYASDVTDEEWGLIEAELPAAKKLGDRALPSCVR